MTRKRSVGEEIDVIVCAAVSHILSSRLTALGGGIITHLYYLSLVAAGWNYFVFQKKKIIPTATSKYTDKRKVFSVLLTGERQAIFRQSRWRRVRQVINNRRSRDWDGPYRGWETSITHGRVLHVPITSQNEHVWNVWNSNGGIFVSFFSSW